jgi:hypothetical protein
VSEARVDVKGKPGRCAYCHDDVAVEERTACAACLAVHHTECWSQDRKCASCGEQRVLAAPSAAPESLDARTAEIGRSVIVGDKAALRKAILRTSPHLKAQQFKVQALSAVGFLVLLIGAFGKLLPFFLAGLVALFVAAILFQLCVHRPADQEAARLKAEVADALARGHGTRSGAKEPT